MDRDFFQEYTNAIRKFTLEDDGNVLNINHYPEIFDSVHSIEGIIM
ncbi:MAG: hypothetical protein IPG79_18555 [Saprospiraceae bacterium]|nr:hypothetical protein [Saprospiraceae bacterium]